MQPTEWQRSLLVFLGQSWLVSGQAGRQSLLRKGVHSGWCKWDAWRAQCACQEGHTIVRDTKPRVLSLWGRGRGHQKEVLAQARVLESVTSLLRGPIERAMGLLSG